MRHGDTEITEENQESQISNLKSQILPSMPSVSHSIHRARPRPAAMAAHAGGGGAAFGGFGTDQIDGGENHDLIIGGETTTTNEEFAVDLLQMLATWVASHPANLATSVLSPDDLAVDTLLGSSGDDDFYLGAGDITPDYRISPEHGNDRRFP